MVGKIREQLARLFKMLVGSKEKETEVVYVPVWFPATRDNRYD
jgi:hypothetical protein